MITEEQILEAQNGWGKGIIKIGQVFLEKQDYKLAAAEHIKTFYNYQEGKVLFKPTLASLKQFRLDFDAALSYFVGGNDNFPEDHGFAIKPWVDVQWENIGTTIVDNVGLAMGNYYFTPHDGSDVVKVEYSFGYTRDRNGALKIVLHDSHVPFPGS
ncbi:MAG: phosphoribosyl-AMP cyclohydrolase [Phycisphaerae bacterium]|nr:phosphoribosyl-AMP cyclohydrolase [Phycisphaerae bacterium]